MSALTLALAGLLCLGILAAAWLAVRGEGEAGLPVAILASGLVSLLASVLLLLLAAPDVAMTEAAIGSGLTTFLFFYVLHRLRTGTDKEEQSD